MASIGILGFKLLEKIGEGGMAEVYKARQLSLDRIVAVKILRADMAADPSALAQFRMEANAVAHLKHTNIVQVHEAGCRDDIHYFVMEYVAGYSVADWIERKGRLPEDDALLVAEYTARALDYAWEHSGLIHGDIKPDNVLVDEDGAIKIADFSGLHGVGRGPADQPVDDDIIGTPNYMSPEQARGERDLDIRSDMYAVGALLYHMVTGRIPFRNRDERAVMAAQAEDFLPNPRELEPSVSPACALLIRKLMSKSRADRPADWPAFFSDLHRARAGQPPRDGVPENWISTVRGAPGEGSLPPPPPRPSRKRSKAAAAAALALLVLAALGTGLWWQFGREEPPPPLERLRDDPESARDAPPADSMARGAEPVRSADDAVRIERSMRPERAAPEPAVEPAAPRTPQRAEYAPPENPEAVRSRAYREALDVLVQALARVRARDLEAGRSALEAWARERPGHPYRERAERDAERIGRIAGVFDGLERRRLSLVGKTFPEAGSLPGRVADLREGNVVVKRVLGGGEAEMEVPLRSLPPRDLAPLLLEAHPESAPRALAVLLIADFQFDRANAAINRAEAAGLPVDDLVSWSDEWQMTLLNRRADQALDEAIRLMEAGRAAECAERLAALEANYAFTDVLSWARRDDVRRLSARARQAAAAERMARTTRAGGPEATGEPPAGRLSVDEMQKAFWSYNGRIVELFFRCRGRIAAVESGRYETELGGGGGFVRVEFPDEAARWMRGIPLGNMEAPPRSAFGRVRANRQTVELVGRILRPEGDGVRYEW
jgi:eukaryotic-like serine/threonine-protein kinase